MRARSVKAVVRCLSRPLVGRVRGSHGLAAPDITIYHVPHTRGFRLLWLCEELELPYRVQHVDFSSEYRATPEWRCMNPVGKLPVMTDGDFKLFESGAMLQHLLDRYGHGRLQPPEGPGSPEHALFLQWCWFAEATLGRATGEIANHRRQFSAPVEPVLDEMRARARSCVTALDDELGSSQQPYLLGSAFTAADIMTGYSLQSFERNVGEAPPAHVAAYLERLRQRPAFLAAAAANEIAKA
jgi:glutathione S-transferase